MTMMENITRLNGVDTRLRSMQSQLQSAQTYRDRHQQALEDTTQDLQEIKEQKKITQAHLANLEIEGAALDEKLEKFRKDLNSAADNKQYAAVLTEMNTVKLERGRIDDEGLDQLASIEKAEVRIQELTTQVEEETKLLDHAENQLQEKTGELSESLSTLEKERQEAAAVIPDDALSVFDSLMDVNDGEAMAQVEEVDRRNREYACGACYMHVPFELVANLTSGRDTLVHCNSCRRILYLDKELMASYCDA